MLKHSTLAGTVLLGITSLYNATASAAVGDTFASGLYSCTVVSESPKTAEINSYTGSDEDLTIPQTVLKGRSSYKVVAIGSNAFADNSLLKSVTVPDGVTAIGERAFGGCKQLESVNIPDGVTSIEKYTFNGCSSLTEINLPETIESIGYYALASCGFTDISLPKSLKIIDEAALCFNLLTSVEIPESVESIGNSAFIGSNLTTVTTNSDAALANLGNIVCSSPVNTVNTDLQDYVWDGSALYNKDKTTLILVARNIGSIAIAPTVSLIADYALCGCTTLSTVDIPQGTTKLGNSSFASCTAMTSVTIPNSVSYIDAAAFYNCLNLTTVVIPESVTYIGALAFAYCRSLGDVTIPNGLTSLERMTFAYCTSLSSVTIPESIIFIDLSYFENSSFERCSALTTVTTDSQIILQNFGKIFSSSPITRINTTSANFIWDNTFLYNKDKTTLIYTSEDVEKIEIPNTVTTIAARGCYCISGKLRELVVGNSITYVEEQGIYSGALSSLTFKSETPPTGIEDMYFGPYDIIIYVPSGTYEAYRATIASGYKDIRENESTSIVNTIEESGSAPIELYNLKGQRVSTNELLPGIYIRRQGSQTHKIIINR